jgi:hypothetical protein
MNFSQPSINDGLPAPSALNGMAGAADSMPTSFPIPSGGAMDFDQSMQLQPAYGPDTDITMFTELLPQERSDWNFASIFNNDARSSDTASQSNGAFDAFMWNFENNHNNRTN